MTWEKKPWQIEISSEFCPWGKISFSDPGSTNNRIYLSCLLFHGYPTIKSECSPSICPRLKS